MTSLTGEPPDSRLRPGSRTQHGVVIAPGGLERPGRGRPIAAAGSAVRPQDRLQDRPRERPQAGLQARLELRSAIDALILSRCPIADVAAHAVAGLRTLVGADLVAFWAGTLPASPLTLLASDGDRDLEGLAARAARTATTPADAPARAGDGVRSWCSVTLGDPERPSGTLILAARAAQAFDADALAVAREVGGALAVALSQADLRDEAERAGGRLADALDAAPNATLLVGADGLIRYASAAVIRMFGHDSDALVGQALEWLLPGAGSGASVLGERRRARAAGADREAHRADGSIFPVEVVTRSIDLPDGPGYVVCVVDLAERRALEAQLLQAQKLALMGQVASVLAHDFRNYLNAISGFAQLLEMVGPLDGAQLAGLTRIVDTVDHANGAVESMLAFARPRATSEVTDDLAAHLEASLGMLDSIARPASRVELVVAKGLPPVCVEPAALTQVLMNLVSNARDAMPAGGRITISARAEDPSGWARRAGDRVAIEVRDTGAGMAPETRDRVFEPFFSTKRVGASGSGNGLGLASVQMIVARAGGDVTVDSTPGCGTTFRVSLPVVVPAGA